MSLFNFLVNAITENQSNNPYERGRGKEYPYENINEIPSEMGTYRFKNNNQIMYIGISNDLRRRVMQHKRAGKKFFPGEKVSIQIAKSNATYSQVRRHEELKVRKHKPERNERGGGGGREPNLDVD